MEMQPYHLLTGIGIALVIGVLSLIWSERPDLAEYIRRRLFTERPAHNMSSSVEGDETASGTAPVHVPVLRTDTACSTSRVVLHAGEGEIPDTTAAEAGTDAWETPRISTTLSDDSIVVMLAAQRGANGKWRFSANRIFELVGGSRAAVLAQVREVQQGVPPAEFRPLSDEQRAAREALGLPSR